MAGKARTTSAASTAIKLANRTLSRAERIAQYAIVQEELAKDMPSLPLFSRLEVLATAPNLTGLAPSPGEPFYTWNIHTWSLPGQNTIVIGLPQEPASLFPLIDNYFLAELAASLIYGRGLTNLNYDLQAQLYQSLPTIENGGAVSNTVNVGAGTIVVDANGDVVQLAVGVTVLDASGQAVTYMGGTLPMAQLTITGTFNSNLKWSNGMTLTQADLRLWDTVNCDRDSGAISFFVCDRIASRQYSGDATASYTLLPGYLPPDYSTHLPGAYPSQRVLSDGRQLKDVPPAAWYTLPEITRMPLGLGPYAITSWNSGVNMTFAANPYFGLGVPQTPNIEIRFVDSASEAVAQLLAGTIHVLGPESLGAGAEAFTVIDAARNGQAQAFVLPSAIWEHIDMNLAIFFKTFLPLVNR